MILTSVDEGIDILDLPDGRVVAVGHQGLHGVQQAVNIDDGPGAVVRVVTVVTVVTVATVVTVVTVVTNNFVHQKT